MDTEAVILNQKYERIIKTLQKKNLKISVMGNAAAARLISCITETEGASEVLNTCFTLFTDESKIQFGIPKEKIGNCMEEAALMAEICREKWKADIGVGMAAAANAVYISITYGGKTHSETVCERDKNAAAERIGEIILNNIMDTEDILEFKINEKYSEIVQKLKYHKLKIAAMESCTGGYIASCITDVEGASEVIGNSFVTYTNDAKINQGVPEKIIEEYGVYSAETAEAMAEAATNGWRDADIGIGITGTIGRIDPANKDSVADTVYVCVKFRNNEVIDTVEMHPGSNSRTECKKILAADIADIIIHVLSSVTLHI